MIDYKDHVPLIQAVEKLGEASLKAGITEEQVVNLLASDLELSQLLEYLDAMLSHRVH
jgi:hypothetical protein